MKLQVVRLLERELSRSESILARLGMKYDKINNNEF